MLFSKFNKERMFTYDCSGFDYVSLKELWQKNPDENHVYTIRGAYINTRTNSEYHEEAPIVVIDGTYVNIPDHQLEQVRAMIEDQRAIAAINNGEAGFTIKVYEQRRFKKTCFKAVWCDVTPADV